MAIIITLSVLSFIAWLHAVILRIRKNDDSYNKNVFIAAVVIYLFCNFIQTQTFEHKTIFNLFFSVYSLLSIPFHIWLITSWTKSKKNVSR
ncbi:hypothetical protein QOZ95_005058 [Paenibacillus brasilensis]|uniref:Group-specific protein n=1 Tax=Paenibacillus brasilensis TaxID=128574 RepID=A0ABU0L6C7_9BACL|nr:hypothetical protein [Paenibacillus brasilensis]